MYRSLFALPLLLGPVSAARAADPAINLPQVDVVAATPLPGSGIAADDLPQATTVLGTAEIARTGAPTLTGTLLEQIPGAALNDVDGNPFQPDILYRGFTASPVAGGSQGLAVYVNGARFNEPFGDTVNWDLIPPSAIASAELQSSNPVFGLNALGGSLNVTLKNGFTWQGAELTAYGGSYDRGVGIIEYGKQIGNFAIYATGDISHDSGFRQTQSSDLYRLYTDLGWRNERAEIHLGVTADSNSLGNPGASPVQALHAELGTIFTGPNTVFNKYLSVNLNGTYALDDVSALSGVAYYQNLTQRLPNGITEEVEPCDDDATLLCNEEDGSNVTTRGGVPLPYFRADGLYSGLVLEGLNSSAYGASAQYTRDAAILGHANHLVVGASFDGSDNVFDAQTQIGGLDPATHLFIEPGYTVDQPEAGVNPVRVATTTRDYAIFADDLFNVTDRLQLNLAGRFNNVNIDLSDKLGGPVVGQHAFSRFNPSIGLTYHILPKALGVFASYNETTRAPTPTELSCASAANPCSLLNFFVGDPDLKQVVARTFEVGARGTLGTIGGGTLRWDVDYYHTKTADDIIFEPTSYNVNLQYYTNVGATLHQGVEANLRYATARLRATLGYAFTEATFQNYLTLNSGDNPAADENGLIHVTPGDRIPGVPLHRGTATADYKVTDRWTVGGSAILQSSQYRFGDEANQTKPVGGYVILNANTSYRLTDRFTLFALVNNLTNRRYDTYGTFGPVGDVPWNFVPGGVTDSRTANPGTPITWYAGVRVTL